MIEQFICYSYIRLYIIIEPVYPYYANVAIIILSLVVSRKSHR